jgi:hypothetical protein
VSEINNECVAGRTANLEMSVEDCECGVKSDCAVKSVAKGEKSSCADCDGVELYHCSDMKRGRVGLRGARSALVQSSFRDQLLH